MIVQGISNSMPVYNKAAVRNVQTAPIDEQQKNTESAQDKPVSVPANILLAQLPKVSFGGRYNYGSDDLSPYDDYDGPQPPLIEIRKYRISKAVQDYIKEEDYLSAIKGKLELASICRDQGKECDTFILEESIRRLYKDLPIYQREEAKDAIRAYNYDMAEYIDEDIKGF